MAFTPSDLTEAKNVLKEQFRDDLLNIVPTQSNLLSRCTRMKNLSAGITRMPIVSGLVDVELKDHPTDSNMFSKATFDNAYINRIYVGGKTAISKQDISDATASGFTMIEFIKKNFIEAAQRKLEKTILFASGLPNDIKSVYEAITANGQLVQSTLDPNALYEDIFGVDGIMAMVENNGFDPSAFACGTSLKASLRSLKDANGRPLYYQSVKGDNDSDALASAPLIIIPQSFWDSSKADLIVGDWKNVYYAMGEEFDIELSREGTMEINGEMISLFDRSMIGLKFDFSFGFYVHAPLNYENRDKENVCAFAGAKKIASIQP